MKKASRFTALALVVFFLAVCGEDDKEPDPDPIEEDPVWTAAANSTFGSNTINCVAWGSNKFVAGGDNGRMAYSADGVTWTAVTNSTFSAGAVNCIVWADGKFMAGGDGGRMAYSADGITWTAVANSSFSANAVNGLAFGSGKWAAAGRTWIAYSNADGTTWTGTPANNLFNFLQGPPTLNAVGFSGSRFVLAGALGGQGHGGSMAASTDGINWTVIDIEELTGSAVEGIAFGSGKWAAVTSDLILYSSNGTAWDATVSASGRRLYDVTFAAGKFTAVGVSDTIEYSSDAINWTAYDVSLNSHFRGVAYGNNTWVAVGQDGAIAYLEESTN